MLRMSCAPPAPCLVYSWGPFAPIAHVVMVLYSWRCIGRDDKVRHLLRVWFIHGVLLLLLLVLWWFFIRGGVWAVRIMCAICSVFSSGSVFIRLSIWLRGVLVLRLCKICGMAVCDAGGCPAMWLCDVDLRCGCHAVAR
jgi:hypothetical protein